MCVYIYRESMEFSVIKKNEIMLKMDLEIIISEVRKRKTDTI